jgi:hypothetical protein
LALLAGELLRLTPGGDAGELLWLF